MEINLGSPSVNVEHFAAAGAGLGGAADTDDGEREHLLLSAVFEALG
jgi:hypothetical protein